MAKRLFCFQYFFCLIFFLCGCSNSNYNIFSWAHISGSGDGSYDSFISDGDSAMQSENYGKAAEYYKSAVKKKPGDTDAVMGYASAAVADVLGSSTADIIEKVLEGDTSDLLSKISDGTIAKMDKVLKELVNDKDMFTALFEVPNPPTDSSSNLNGAVVYALSGIVSAVNDPSVKAHIKVGGDFYIDIGYLPAKPSDSREVSSAVSNINDNLVKALMCLNNINDVGLVAGTLKEALSNMNSAILSWLSKG